MDICLESFNPYAINEEEVINEGTNIFAKALEVLSKIWHKILDTITGFLNKFKKKSKNTTAAQFKKTCADKNITEVNCAVIDNLGKMFKSHDSLTEWISLVGEGLDIVSKYLSIPGGDGKHVGRANDLIDYTSNWYNYFLNYTSTKGFSIKTSPEEMVEIMRTAMITSHKYSEPDNYVNKNILDWNGTGYSLDQIFDDDGMFKLRTTITKHLSMIDGLKNKLNSTKVLSPGDEKSANAIKNMQRALNVVLETNRAAGSIINSYLLSIVNIRRKTFDIIENSKSEDKVSECFAYIR